MKTKSLLASLSSLGLILGACAALASNPAPLADTGNAGAACAPAGQRLAALTVKPGDATADRAIVWAPQASTDGHKLIENRRVTGACAGGVKAFLVNTAMLESGEGFDFAQDGSVTAREAASLLKPVALTGPAPNQPGQFLGATRVDYRKDDQGLVSDYLGLWRDGDRWTVASFSQRGALNIGTVKSLLHSTVPVKSVTYFPAPDTRAGQISLTLRDTAQSTSLLGFSWRHDQWFE